MPCLNVSMRFSIYFTIFIFKKIIFE